MRCSLSSLSYPCSLLWLRCLMSENESPDGELARTLSELARTLEKSKLLAAEQAALRERVLELEKKVTANPRSQKPRSTVIKPPEGQ
jgi:hypothetical protein